MAQELHLSAARLLPPAAGVTVEAITLAADVVHLTLRVTPAQAVCPQCGTPSGRVHSRYQRVLADLPWAAHRVHCTLHVRRFRCAVATCGRRIFTERLPGLVAPYARRTTRLSRLLQVVGLIVGGRPAVRLCRRLGLPVSLPSLLRLVRRAAPTASAGAARCVGIDDFALRRGQRYGTVLVDLERRCPLDLLPERSAASAATWFADHPAVQLVSRDRAGVYAEGARQGAPQASQVADRWHLLHNLTDALQRVVTRHHHALRHALEALPAPPAACASGPRGAPVPFSAAPEPELQGLRPQRARRRQASQARRQARFTEMERLAAAGVSIRAIAAQLGTSRQTVRRYLRAGAPPADVRGRRPSQVAPFDAYLRARWAAGEQNVAALWRDLRALGFTGGLTSVKDYLARWRTTPGRPGRAAQARVATPSAPPPDQRVPSARQVTWWLLADPTDLEADQRAIVAHLCATVPTVRTAIALVQRFVTLVRQRSVADLDPWFADAMRSNIPELRGVATSMRQDLAAVEAALTSPHSNGQTEGHVTRIKLLKRSMYGRGGFDLLRLRVLYRDTDEAVPP